MGSLRHDEGGSYCLMMSPAGLGQTSQRINGADGAGILTLIAPIVKNRSGRLGAWQ
jgi:hypothetical protein